MKKGLKLASVLSAITICSIMGSASKEAHANGFTRFFRTIFQSTRNFFTSSNRPTSTSTSTTVSSPKIKTKTSPKNSSSTSSMTSPNLRVSQTFDVDGARGPLDATPKPKVVKTSKIKPSGDGKTGEPIYSQVNKKRKTNTGGVTSTSKDSGKTGESKEPVYTTLFWYDNTPGNKNGYKVAPSKNTETIYTKVKGSPAQKGGADGVGSVEGGFNETSGSKTSLSSSLKKIWGSGSGSGKGTKADGETPPPLPPKQSKPSTSGGTGEKPPTLPLKKTKTSGTGDTGGKTGDRDPSALTVTEKIQKVFGGGSGDGKKTPQNITTFGNDKKDKAPTPPPKSYSTSTSKPSSDLKPLTTPTGRKLSPIPEEGPPVPERTESLTSKSYTGPVLGDPTGKSQYADSLSAIREQQKGKITPYTGTYTPLGDPTGTKPKMYKK